MSKSSKNQKSITSFFKNPAQPSAAKEPEPAKPKSPPPVNAKQPKIEPEVPKSPPRAPLVLAPKKPTVVVCPSNTLVKKAAHEGEWINLSDRFLLNSRNFDVQYAHLYAERLGSMRKLVAQAAENRWGA